MWPFSARKEGGGSRIGNPPNTSRRKDPPLSARSIPKFLQSSSAEELQQLRLSPVRIRTLKKILHYHSTRYTNLRDFDIFVVSWDVHDLPEPPDDISPLLPPEQWPEPDIMVIGLRRCSFHAAPLWSSVVARSIYRYSPVFKPVSPEAPYDEDSGCLLLVFLRTELLPFVQGYASRVVPGMATGVRFDFQQACIAFVCAKFEVSNIYTFTSVDPFQSLDPDQISTREYADLETRMAFEAASRQRFASLIDQLWFDVRGRRQPLTAHTVCVFLGIKDAEGRACREEKLLKAIFVASKQAERSTIQSTLDSSNPYATLDRHDLDVRFNRRVAMCPKQTSKFGTFINLPSIGYKGRVDILKAGVMRLVLELLDDRGVATPSQAAPELVLLRCSIPSVDSVELRGLYFKVWRLLKDAKPTDVPTISLKPQLVKIDKPLQPWVPYTIRFRIVNNSENHLPAAFQIYCLSDSGTCVVPIGRHSFLHQALSSRRGRSKEAALAAGDALPAEPSTALTPANNQSGGPATSHPLPVVDMRKVVDLQKRAQKRSQSRSSTRPKQKSALAGLLNMGKGKRSNKHRLLTADESPSAARNLLARSSDLEVASPPLRSRGSSSTVAPQSSISIDTTPLVDLQDGTSHSPTDTESRRISPDDATSSAMGGQSTPGALKSARIPTPFSLTKWMLVDPLEGVVLAGDEMEIRLTIMIQEGIESDLVNLPPVILVVRVDDCNRDFFLHIEPNFVRASFIGLGPTQLLELKDTPICAVGSPQQSTKLLNPIDPPEASGRRRTSFASPKRGPLGGKEQLPLPKELWSLLSFIHLRLIYDLNPTHDSLPPAWRASDLADYSWTCLPMVLQRAARGWENLPPQQRQDMVVLSHCLETHTQIPPSVSIEAALRTIEKWGMSLPVPLVPREYITEIHEESEGSSNDEKLHLICRAALLSLPTIARNILVSLTAVLRELLVFHALTVDIMVPPAAQVINVNPAAPIPPLRQFATPQKCTELLEQLAQHPRPLDLRHRAFLFDALTQWVARYVTRDTPGELSFPFIRHFLVMA